MGLDEVTMGEDMWMGNGLGPRTKPWVEEGEPGA